MGIDAALYSGSKTYFFSGNQYIRVTRDDTGPGTVDPGYPASLSAWNWPAGFGASGIDAALFSGSKTYFFSGNQYIRVTRDDTGPGTVDPGYPASLSAWNWPAGFGSSENRLQFTVQPQVQTNWCWAAVSASTSLFYDSGSTWTQCSVANAELAQTTCCADGSTTACNVPWYLDLALTRTGNYVSFSSGSAALATVASQVDSGRLVGVRIGWSGGGGHFVLLEGFRDSPSTVYVEDPIYGASDVSYDVFRTAYQGSGSWTHTYLTSP